MNETYPGVLPHIGLGVQTGVSKRFINGGDEVTMCVSNNLLSPTVLYSCSYKTFPFGELIVNAFPFPTV